MFHYLFQSEFATLITFKVPSGMWAYQYLHSRSKEISFKKSVTFRPSYCTFVCYIPRSFHLMLYTAPSPASTESVRLVQLDALPDLTARGLSTEVQVIVEAATGEGSSSSSSRHRSFHLDTTAGDRQE